MQIAYRSECDTICVVMTVTFNFIALALACLVPVKHFVASTGYQLIKILAPCLALDVKPVDASARTSKCDLNEIALSM